MKSKRLRIRGAPWKLVWGKPPLNKCAALCDEETRTIWIRPSLNKTPEEAILSLHHEILHAAFPDLHEDAVIEAEQAFAAGLELLPLLWDK